MSELHTGDNVVPIEFRRDNEIEDQQTLAEFSHQLLARLNRHPSTSARKGEELAAIINAMFKEHLFDSDESGEETYSEKLVYNVNRIIDQGGIFIDDEMYQNKKDSDLVFYAIQELLQDNSIRGKEMREQRTAAIKLLELRGTIHANFTDDDPEWMRLIYRLVP